MGNVRVELLLLLPRQVCFRYTTFSISRLFAVGHSQAHCSIQNSIELGVIPTVILPTSVLACLTEDKATLAEERKVDGLGEVLHCVLFTSLYWIDLMARDSRIELLHKGSKPSALPLR